MAQNYNVTKIEEKWLDSWEKQQLFQGVTQADVVKADAVKTGKDPLYLLFAFAYPSGSGLHVGHVESKTALDILARYYRMNNRDVFFPVGWDAFGLPAENYAIKTGVPPAETTRAAIDTFRRQIKRIGISYDWKAELATSHPGYYRWTQWLFLELHRQGLAYQGEGVVNWCPSCQTVLANEQVVDGACERCGSEVTQKSMKQWYFKITEYKDELISGLDEVDWPTATKEQQLNWIGRRVGAQVQFSVESAPDAERLACFTTRVDTIFGVTFLAMSPEKWQSSGLMEQVSAQKRDEIEKYLKAAGKKTEEQRKIGEKDKTGIDTGLTAINPVNGQVVPIYVADYILAGYGTGVVMGVPGHDERDHSFARKHQLPIIEVITPAAGAKKNDKSVFTEHGVLQNSGNYTGLSSEEAIGQLLSDFNADIEKTTTYKLRDWLISRQRYWGAPIPIVYDPDGNPHPVKDEHLPWLLPTDVDFKPTGESPLRSSQEFIQRTEKLYGKGWRPEFDTMDTFVDSSWYFLRYLDARNEQVFAQPELLKYWLPVDFYMIGPEHIVLHLLYSRFFAKFLRDQGYLEINEPFSKMRHQGMILGPDGKKMSKSKGNVINPDDVIEKFGADTLRVYEMFMGPIESDKPWDVSAVAGVYRFLNRIYDLVVQVAEGKAVTNPAVKRKLHQTIRKVSSDIPALKFNTAIAAMMECLNDWETSMRADKTGITREEARYFTQILAPFAPFLAEELHELLGGKHSVHTTEWPTWDDSIAAEQSVEIPVQINGKVRGKIKLPAEQASDQAVVIQAARADERIAAWLAEAKIIKEIYVPRKILNIVVKI
ncbi:MAG: leucine--tRNA ligase [Patescibacteria group bacterium]